MYLEIIMLVAALLSFLSSKPLSVTNKKRYSYFEIANLTSYNNYES
jgi:hypothetical protein